jgi:PilZ domain
MTADTSATLPQSPEQTSSASIAAPANWCANGTPGVEKRRETRYATCEPVDVYLLDMNNLRLGGMLRDVSKNGMRIELDMPLKVADRLEVLLQNKAIVFAEVRYCRRTGESYQVGTSIDDVYYPRTAAPSRTPKIVVSESISKQVSKNIRFAEKRPADSPERRALGRASKSVFHQVVSFRDPVTREHLGAHVDRYDIDNLLRLRFSETKAALLERHLASCDQCLDLVLRTLEERASFRAAGPKNARGQI